MSEFSDVERVCFAIGDLVEVMEDIKHELVLMNDMVREIVESGVKVGFGGEQPHDA